jgi:hypothetical protein
MTVRSPVLDGDGTKRVRTSAVRETAAAFWLHPGVGETAMMAMRKMALLTSL